MVRKKDCLILSRLRRNSRETLTEMSRKTGIPISTIFDRLKTKNNGLIKSFTAIVDFEKLGYSTRANIILKLKREQRAEFVEKLRNHQNVNSVIKINNGFDFLLDVIFRNVKELEDFMEQLECTFKITQKQVYYIIEELRKEAFMADQDLLDVLFEN